jgi:hemolysin III
LSTTRPPLGCDTGHLAPTVAGMHPENFDFITETLRPRYRGRLHAAATLAALPAGSLLVLLASGAAATAAAVVYVLSMITTYTVSAGYHILARTRRSQLLMRRLDHSTIFLLIAGTYTPLCLIALPASVGVPLLLLVWSGAVLGAVLKITGRAWRAASALYLLLGWVALAVLPALWHTAGALPALLLLAGGVVYTAGSVVFFLKRPRLSPEVFGSHELWHAATLLAGALHFAAVLTIVH